MARAAVRISQEIKDEFSRMNLQMGDYYGWLKIVMNFEQHQLELEAHGEQVDDVMADIYPSLVDDSHAFYIFKVPLENAGKKFLLMHWGPDTAPVKQRMIYASARQGLRDGLGSNNFVEDYHVSLQEEVTKEAFYKDRVVAPTIDVRSGTEIEQEESHRETMPTVTRTAVMAKMSVKLGDGIDELFVAFVSEQNEGLTITLDTKKMSITAEDNIGDIDSMLNTCTGEEACYFLLRWRHQNRQNEEAAKVLFFYYCPEDAPRRKKFTYSTSKSGVLAQLEANGINVDDKFEFVEINDVTDDMLMNSLYPVVVEQKELVKTKAGGRKGKRKRRNKRAALDFDD